MRRFLRALLGQCGHACICAPVILALCGSAFGQAGTKAQYEVYSLKHKPVAEVEKMLAEMLADLSAETHLVADPRANQILLRGPQQAQQIARQLIQSVDRPAAGPAAEKPAVKGYSCPKGRLADVANSLRALYSGRRDVRIAADPKAARLMILAPAEVHKALPRQLAALGAQVAGDGTAPTPAPPVAPKEQFVALAHGRVEGIEPKLRGLFGSRLRPMAGGRPEQKDYVFIDAAGRRVDLSIDRRRNGLMLSGNGSLVTQLERLIRTLDGPVQAVGKAVRIVPLHKADPAKVQEAIEAYRSGRGGLPPVRPRLLPPGKSGNATPTNGRPGPGASDQGRIHYGGIELVNYLFQPAEGAAGGSAEGDAASQQGAPGEAEQRRDRLRELGTDVEIETLPDLDVIILRGRQRDVEELSRIIEEIERISAETVPVIDVYQLRHVGGETLAAIVAQINEDLLGGRQGRVSVTPLVKPNALLLIGWGEAVKAVKELITKLDQPVAPETQLQVFRLRHAPAAAAQATVNEFFSGRTGLGPKVQVTADTRTNSLVVQASPRDMAEVDLLLQRLDQGQSQAVSRARVFKLKNSLAADLSSTLQAAINAARGGGEGRSAVLEFLTIDAEQERILKSGILDDVQITPDPRANTVIVSAPVESMELLGALIEQLDSPASVAQIKVFRIVSGNANALVQMLRSLLPSQTGAGTGTQLAGAEGETSLVPVRFSVDTRTNSIIAVGSRGDLGIIEALLLRLDEEDVQQRQNAVYRLKNAPALDMARAINEFLRSERQVQQAAPGEASPFQQIEAEVVVVPEPVSNALIISATPRFFKEIKDLVEKLDAQPPQVMIQILIGEVALGNVDEFGVELGLQDSILFDRSLLGDLITTTETFFDPQGNPTATTETIQSATMDPGYAFNNKPLGNSGSGKSLSGSNIVGGQGLSSLAVGRLNTELGYGGLVLSASSEAASVLIRALQESRRLDVLARPQIMTLDNQPAFIQVGKRVPRITGTLVNQVGQVNNIVLENVGLILGVTPRISPDGMVVMELDAEKSDLGPLQEGIPVAISEGQEIRSPTINVTTAQTTVSANSGETIVLGGLITKSASQIHRRVPLLADIPILGHLFRYDSQVCRRTELLIILTPHVVRNQEEAERLKQCEAARMHWCLGDVQQIHGDTGLWKFKGCTGPNGEAAVIYPDFNPRGSTLKESVPGEGSRLDPSAEEIPAPLGQPGGANLLQPESLDRAFPGELPADSVPDGSLQPVPNEGEPTSGPVLGPTAPGSTPQLLSGSRFSDRMTYPAYAVQPGSVVPVTYIESPRAGNSHRDVPQPMASPGRQPGVWPELPGNLSGQIPLQPRADARSSPTDARGSP